MLEPVVKTIEVPCSKQKAFDVFTKDINNWWPLHKNSVSAMAGETAKELIIDLKVGGTIVEIGHDGIEHLWGSVKTYAPYSSFSMNWHIGVPESSASLVEVQFEKLSDDLTRVVLTHSNWEAFGDKANDMRDGYNKGWVGVFEQAFAQACHEKAGKVTG